MALQLGMITMDTLAVGKLSQWWADQLGGQVAIAASDTGGYFAAVTLPNGISLGFQLVAEPTPGKNRIHLDLGADDRAAEVARLEAAGATIAWVHDDPQMSWVTMADPDGNLFCVSQQES